MAVVQFQVVGLFAQMMHLRYVIHLQLDYMVETATVTVKKDEIILFAFFPVGTKLLYNKEV